MRVRRTWTVQEEKEKGKPRRTGVELQGQMAKDTTLSFKGDRSAARDPVGISLG